MSIIGRLTVGKFKIVSMNSCITLECITLMHCDTLFVHYHGGLVHLANHYVT